MKVIACNMVSPGVSCGIGKSTPAPKYEKLYYGQELWGREGSLLNCSIKRGGPLAIFRPGEGGSFQKFQHIFRSPPPPSP